ncbi:MAG: NADPH-dependent oxidoreductase [Planctomycetota bacterium]
MNDTIALLKNHRTIRRFTDEPVPDGNIREAVAAGQMASTSSAVQAYSILRVRDDIKRRKIAELCGPQDKVAECPAFFVVCADSRRHRLAAERDGFDYDQRLEAFLVGVIDASLFAEKMAIALESMGYGICYIGGLRNCLSDVDAVLGTPEGVYPLFGLCVGRPDEEPSRRPRLPVDAVLMEETYDSDDRVLAKLDEYDATYRAYLADRGAPSEDGWSQRMAQKYPTPSRPDLAAFYAGKGADLR